MILQDIVKSLGGKIASAAIALAAFAAGYWCYQHPEEMRTFGRVVKYTLIWLVVTAALPWSSYLFMRPMMELQSRMTSAGAAQVASIGLIAAYTGVNIFHAFWLASWDINGGLTWLVVILGFGAAAAYNFFICESLARHVDR